ncbi:MAG: deoxyguanosinetriphosphate triphosphohydrolase [Clostridia bacterium]|nr:deoxyguanosinetriphosphate triphosphohydrolase [Clostridia bacterium]
MNYREIQEQRELDTLSPFATKSADSKGRLTNEPKCDQRTDFQRDRDRVIHSKAFRRLSHKTQVFLSPTTDHFRTRLTHTLEVSQIGRAIARGLLLNEDLEEALALSHDLGHTPFGHTGERALNEICPLGFTHYEQSLRVVDTIEKLNLTFEVRDGIVNHAGNNLAETPEGIILKFADRIAYINHDIDDAIRAGVFTEADLPQSLTDILGKSHRMRINTMIKDIVENSGDGSEIRMSEQVYEAMLGLRSFMFDYVYTSKFVKKEDEKAENLIFKLYEYFSYNKDKMPLEYVEMLNDFETARVVTDYIAGMTDRYAINLFEELFVPKSFS